MMHESVQFPVKLSEVCCDNLWIPCYQNHELETERCIANIISAINIYI